MEHTIDTLPSCDARQVSNILHGAAKAGLRGRDAAALYEAGETAARRVIRETACGLSNTAWAFATAGHEAPVLFDAVAADAIPKLGEFIPQNLSNTAWAFATAEHAASALFDALARESVAKAGAFRHPQDISNTAWAFAKAEHPAPALFDALAVQAVPMLGDFRPQALSNTTWAFATAEHAAPALFDAVAGQAATRLRAVNPQLSRTRRAFASPAHAARPLRRSRGRRWPAARLRREALANLAVAAADAHDADLVAALRRRLEQGGLDLAVIGVTQPHQAQPG